MKKNLKASIAISAGVLLLLGGAGSLAYWNSGAVVGEGNTITAGQLKVTANTPGTWQKSFYAQGGRTPLSGPTTVANISTPFLAVPGNRLTYTQTFTVTASGEDLRFKIETTAGAVAAATNASADVALAAAINGAAGSPNTNTDVTSGFTVNAGGNVVVSTPANPSPPATPTIYKVNANTGTSTITVVWTLDFPFGTGVDNSTQLGAVTLTNGAITLTQVAAS